MFPDLPERWKEVHRRILAGTCAKYRDDATGIGKYEELELQTGMRHGFIYRPDDRVDRTDHCVGQEVIFDAFLTRRNPLSHPGS